MRMSDLPTVEETLFINAPPTWVWELVTDLNMQATLAGLKAAAEQGG